MSKDSKDLRNDTGIIQDPKTQLAFDISSMIQSTDYMFSQILSAKAAMVLEGLRPTASGIMPPSAT